MKELSAESFKGSAMNLGQLPVRIDVIPVPYADQKLPCSIGALFAFLLYSFSVSKKIMMLRRIWRSIRSYDMHDGTRLPKVGRCKIAPAELVRQDSMGN